MVLGFKRSKVLMELVGFDIACLWLELRDSTLGSHVARASGNSV